MGLDRPEVSACVSASTYNATSGSSGTPDCMLARLVQIQDCGSMVDVREYMKLVSLLIAALVTDIFFAPSLTVPS